MAWSLEVATNHQVQATDTSGTLWLETQVLLDGSGFLKIFIVLCV